MIYVDTKSGVCSLQPKEGFDPVDIDIDLVLLYGLTDEGTVVESAAYKGNTRALVVICT